MRITESLKSEFLLPEDISYLNCAYMSPLSRKTVEAGKSAVELKGFPFRIKPEDFFETTELIRNEFATLINGSPENIAVVPSVSYGFANLAANVTLEPGDEIIVIEEQFPSNIYIWQRIAREKGASITVIDIPASNSGRGKSLNKKILESITSKTRVVTMGTLHWSDGTLFDLTAIRKKTREYGALLLLDGTQSVGALPLDVTTLQPDGLVVAGYKWLMCPYSTGFVWLADSFKDGLPIEESWINRKDSSNFAGLVNYVDDYESGMRRYDMGEKSNFTLNPMVLTALRQVNEWGPGNIQDYCSSISQSAISQLQDIGYWIEEADMRAKHIFGIRVPEGTNLEDIKRKCEEKKIFVSIRGTAVRVAPHVYNDVSDFEKLVEVLK